jgi:hypothetical protein
VLSGHAHRLQAAAATVLIVSSGHAPHVLGRLVTLTVGLVLVARAVVTERERAYGTSAPVEGGHDTDISVLASRAPCRSCGWRPD